MLKNDKKIWIELLELYIKSTQKMMRANLRRMKNKIFQRYESFSARNYWKPYESSTTSSAQKKQHMKFHHFFVISDDHSAI